MQVASSPFSSALPHSHYHSYYQLHPPGPQDHELKRQYLALLPPQQIIEICLTFDLHVPPYVKSTIWPPDINAAIAGLKKTTPSLAENSLANLLKDGVAVMDSLKSPDPQESITSQTSSTTTAEPQPPDKDKSATPVPSSAATSTGVAETSTSSVQTEENTGSAGSEEPKATTPTLTAQTPPVQPAQAIPPQPAYPHQPYGYGHHQAAYPHTPYYSPHPAGYPYAYGYPPPPPIQNGYHHPHPHPAPAAYPPQPTHYNPIASVSQPLQQEGVGGDDLPSYEEMIVEALTGVTDPEGLAPKDLFTWMASRYPLQSNFRPSASQALQKAYKRGRFEKSSNGRYRLNATWEGGTTSRRATRRPQTHNSQPSSSSGSAPSVSPFTHAPLVHHQHLPSSSSASQSPYPSQAYGYHQQYPGYNNQEQPPTTALGGPSSSSADNKTSAGGPPSGDADSAAAYEAAQNILKAINFGSLLTLPPEERQEQKDEPTIPQQQHQEIIGNGVEQLLSHVQAALASTNAGTASLTIAPPPPETVSDPRAELQAQLALLAAQLAELAQTEEAPAAAASGVGLPALLPPPPPHQHQAPALLPAPPPMNSLSLPTSTPGARIIQHPTTVAPGTPAPPVASLMVVQQALPPEEEESDDDDMEEII